MKKLEEITKKLFEIFEIYIPMVAFLVMFVCFLVVIAYRYIFHASIKEIYEISVISFLWSCIIAASYGSRSEEHVSFTIIYNKLSEKKKLAYRLIGNIFIVATFLILCPYAYESISFMAVKKSSVLGIHFNIIFAPFIFFVFLTLIHHITLLIKDIKQSKAILKGKDEI